MDVRVKIGMLDVSTPETQEIVTGLPDGSLRSLLERLTLGHPELEPLSKGQGIDVDALRIFVNNRQLDRPDLSRYALKDGDTVRLLRRP
jgi:molybdopterin converting factor small subunit